MQVTVPRAVQFTINTLTPPGKQGGQAPPGVSFKRQQPAPTGTNMPRSLARQTARSGSQLQGRPLRRQQLEALLALHALARELVVWREARRVRALRRRAVRRLLLRAAGATSLSRSRCC